MDLTLKFTILMKFLLAQKKEVKFELMLSLNSLSQGGYGFWLFF